MTNRERVIAALRFEQTDRLPYSIGLTEQMYDKVKASPAGLAAWRAANNHITSAGLNSPQTPVAGKPGFFRDEFGVVWNKTGADKDIGVIDGKLITCPEDLEAYVFPEVDEAFVRAQCQWLEAREDGNFSVIDIGFSLFERAWTLCSMEDLLCYMVAEPEFVHALFEKITAYNLKKMDIALTYSFDCCMFGDDWGQQRGLIMGPVHWRRFILPCLRKLYQRAHDAGRWVCQHSCGDISAVLDDVIDAGLNMYQTFQPEIYEPATYKPLLDKRLTIWGGISTQVDLPSKTPARVADITRDTIAVLWRNGGYVAAPTHAVPSDVPVENLLAMLEAFEQAR